MLIEDEDIIRRQTAFVLSEGSGEGETTWAHYEESKSAHNLHSNPLAHSSKCILTAVRDHENKIPLPSDFRLLEPAILRRRRSVLVLQKHNQHYDSRRSQHRPSEQSNLPPEARPVALLGLWPL